MPPRHRASLREVGKTLAGVPQLGYRRTARRRCDVACGSKNQQRRSAALGEILLEHRAWFSEEHMKWLSRLSAPTARYAAPGVVFEVYRARDLHSNRWNGSALKEVALLCRDAYSRYGDRPRLDAYDKKSAIYLVRARYAHIEEWLSIRMVPGDGEPIGVHEPEIFSWGGKNCGCVDEEKARCPEWP